MGIPDWLREQEDRIGQGDDEYVDFSKKKPQIFEEDFEPVVSKPKPKSVQPVVQKVIASERSAGYRIPVDAKARGGQNRWIGVSKEERSKLARKGWEKRKKA